MQRTAQDKARAAQGKRSVGPAVLPELLESILVFCTAFVMCEPEAGLVVLGVADSQAAVLFPRQPVLEDWLDHRGSDASCYRPDLLQFRSDLVGGVSDLLRRASAQAQTESAGSSSRQAAVASAVSSCLCLINRFLVASRSAGAVSALSDDPSRWYLNRSDDEGVVAMMGGGRSYSKLREGEAAADAAAAAARARSWSPRVLILQASDDRSQDYNAMMNCAFAAAKHGIAIDGCFLASAASGAPASSAFLEQACDLTSGIFLAPSGAAQADGALTEVLCSVFLAPLECRPKFNLPALTKVDFRARCFETAEIVDRAYVCNLCLSIFRDRPPAGGSCPTCDAKIHVDKRQRRAAPT
jgi:transcription initiation factor TFIIH subunit 3